MKNKNEKKELKNKQKELEQKEKEVQQDSADTKAEQEEKKELTEKEQIEMLQKEIEDLKERRLRIVAEFENFRRRSTQEKSNWIKLATERLVLELCDVLDNFERALSAPVDKKNIKSFEQGVKMIYKQLESVLAKEGVKKIECMEKQFDPSLHDALAHVPSEKKENTVVAVIQNGYVMNDKVIRPAKVAVSNGTKPQKNEENEKEKKEKEE